MEAPNKGSTESPPQQDEYTHPSRRKGAFRFKSSRSSSSRHSKDHHDHHDHRSSRDHKRRHSTDENHTSRSSKRRHKHKKKDRGRDQDQDQDREKENDHDPSTTQPPLSPSAAFRESLFDALGDDEGAAYWESVYGQPIHTYAVPSVPKGPDGELEQMTEDEYAAYVRMRMWERTREGMEAEQERLRAERRRMKMDEEARARARRGDDRRAFEVALDESLRRGAERRGRRVWEGVWERYTHRWEEISKLRDGGDGTETSLRSILFWPVESGKRKDVTPESVREFMKHVPPPADLLTTLKSERVRWHPDKIQHRYGGMGMDDVVMRSVTEVFQIIDRMWNEERERSGKT